MNTIKLSKNKIKEILNVDIESEYGYVDILEEEKYKSREQNRLFHSLLGCFWKSGCSSFNTYDDMRWHYKFIAGLIEIQYVSDLDQDTKDCLWKAIKVLPLSDKQRGSVIELLRGKVMKEHSWAEASKANASNAITQLLDDMDSAGVLGSKMGAKYEEILRSLGEWYEDSFMKG